ncbi:cupredoxin domain-containing protein [Natronorarus salvus]|uniref:cupredoxin domain-containing protein n=1 Tax=Natronorarus salvus TaxID=3117733 RepID=UPI002F261842
MRRRTWLVAVGTALAGTAGCADLGGGDDGEGESDAASGDTPEGDDTATDGETSTDDEPDDGSADDALDEGDGDDDPEQGAGAEDDPDPSEVVANDEPAAEQVVRIAHDTPRGFDPDVAWIEVGGTVTWESEARDQHDTASIEGRIPEEANGWTSGFLEGGETYSRTFETEGVYDYVCTLHETRMVASVLVGEPDPDGQPGLAEPGDEAGEANPDAIGALNERTRALLKGE